MDVTLLCAGQLLDGQAAVPFKLQMAAVSTRRRLLLVARGYNVLVYDIAHHARIPTLQARLQHAVLAQHNDEINAITLGELHGAETLVAVCDSGRVVAWGVGGGFPVLWEWSGTVSTWGCAIHGASAAVATSANSRRVQIARAPLPDQYMPQLRDETQTLVGHLDNIPCVAFTADGSHLASASIDQTVRIWSVASGECVFAFRYTQWCWCVLFVDPFFFYPADRADAPSCQAGSSPPGSQRSDGDASRTSYPRESPPSRSASPGQAHSPIQEMDHAADVPNGYVSTESTHTADVADGTTGAFGVAGPTGAPALLLCSTGSDLLLLDPARPQLPVVDRIERVVGRTARPTLAEMLAFDRVAFLEWIPELGVALAGSLSGTVAVVRLVAAAAGSMGARPQMQVLARVPEQAPTSQLYGMALYRRPEDPAWPSAVVLYLLFLDGTLAAYELRLPDDSAGIL
ncbi:hypothetical protein H4R19_000042 [Coemansia spiralis]|nr:hypothetical protein H4R19_000042 [Coemansia spiralis]